MHQPVRTVVSPANQQQASHGTEGNQAEQTKGANMARYALIGFIALLAAIFLYQVTGRMLDHFFPMEKERIVGRQPPPRNTPRPERLPGPNVESSPGAIQVAPDYVIRYTGRSCPRSDGSTGAQGYTPDGQLACYRF